jgi:23S rRNA (cytidine1920-2'-O)/16S rRNA (cytidine1409-2'-O)-methyltransferase
LDAELVRRGLTDSRERAQDAVRDGRVLVSGSQATKPGRLVAASEPIELAGPGPRYVGRGGDKLEAALLEFGIEAKGKRCVDIGSSTGGFTDCLLQHGAASVTCVDVGRGQLDWSLRNDPRVVVMERTDVRDVDPSAIGEVDLVTVDVSFISLRTVLPSIAAIAGDADIIVLVKPQFEVGRRNVPKGGVVRDPMLQSQAIADVTGATESVGFVRRGAMPSPVTGAQGNQEFFLMLVRSG